MPTPYKRLTTSEVSALLSTTLGNLKPYQIKQVQEFLERFKYDRGSNSDVSVQSNMTTIVAAVGTNNP